MQALIHSWNTLAVFTANKNMAPLQQFIFLSQAKKRMSKGEWVKE
jgi:hypothetical protein